MLVQRFGARPILLAGSLLHMLGLIATSFSTQYYQYFLAQGVASGIGSSAIFYAGVSTVSTWFAKRQAFAVGVSASGSSLGGVIFPAMVTQLLPQVGFAWTVRAAALVILVLLIVANLTVRDAPLPPPPPPAHAEGRGGKPPGFFASAAAALKSPVYLGICISAVLFSFGYFVTLILLVTVASIRGMPNPVYALVILNAARYALLLSPCSLLRARVG